MNITAIISLVHLVSPHPKGLRGSTHAAPQAAPAEGLAGLHLQRASSSITAPGVMDIDP